LIITNGDKTLQRSVDAKLNRLKFSCINIIHHSDPIGVTIDERRQRISAIHNQAKHNVSKEADFVLLVEDDTTFPPYALKNFLTVFENDPECGFVEGVELSRHNVPYIGGWITDNVYDPTTFRSVMSDDETSHIDAGGFYCALVRTDLYRNHTFKPFDTVGTNGLSCDVNFGLSLSQMGYNNYIDWLVQCDHIGDNGSVNMGNTRPARVVFEKIDGRWLARTEY
jgi:hypothetical protein